MHARKLLVMAAIALSALGWSQEGFQSTVDGTNAAQTQAANATVDLSKVHIDQNLGAQIPMDSEFKDWDGKSVTFRSVLDKPTILAPIFFNCTGVCNVELQDLLTTIQKMKKLRLGKDFDVVILSINPTETPALAKVKRQNIINTLGMPGTEGGWHLLTGTMPNIRSVTDAIGFHYTYDAEKNVVNHPSGLMVVAPSGQVSSYLYGAIYDVPTVDQDLALAKSGQIGPKTTEVFFGCIHVDPVTGKRSIEILNVLKLLGVVTLVVLFGSMIGLSTRKKVNKSTPVS